MNRKDFTDFAEYLDPDQRLGLGTWRRRLFSFKPYNDARLACREYEKQLSTDIFLVLKTWDEAPYGSKLSWEDTQLILLRAISETQVRMNGDPATCVVKCYVKDNSADYTYATSTQMVQYTSASKIGNRFLVKSRVVKEWEEADDEKDSNRQRMK